MPDELPASAQKSSEDGLKGQKMVIYLPQGAVIIERSDVESHPQPTIAPPERSDVESHPQLAAPLIAERANTREYQMLCRVAELLESIAVRMGVSEDTQSVGVTTERIDIVGPAQPSQAIIPERAKKDDDAPSLAADIFVLQEGVDIHATKKHHLDWTRKHHINWMHFINFVFVAYIAFTSIAPAILSTYFDREIFAASSSNARANIYRGDLMVSTLVPPSKLKVNDVVLLRNEETWKLEVDQVQAISTSSNGDSITVTTNSSSATGSRSYATNSPTRIHEITSIISGIGDLSIVLASVFTKIVVYTSLFIVNIIVYMLRARRRRINVE